MGRADTGLSSNSPNTEEVSPNRELEHPVPDEDSDSDIEQGEEDRLGQYMPLSQNPNDGEPLYGSNNESDDENISEENDDNTEAVATGISNVPDVLNAGTVLIEEVWSKPPPKEVDIELTEKKIDLVKEVMSGIQLPFESIPEWAKNIPEEDWKNHLLAKLNKSDVQK